MYFVQVCNWFYQCMQVPVPIVIFNNQVTLVTIFDNFMFLVYLGIFITLLNFIITGTLDFNVYGEDFHYSSGSSFNKSYNKKSKNDVNRKYTRVTKDVKPNRIDNEYVFFHRRKKIYNSKSMASRIIFKKKGK